MDQFVQSGQYLSGRYQLIKPFDEQPPFTGTTLWVAADKLLGTEVRVLILDPRVPMKQEILDTARRSALVDGARVVRVLSVSDSADSVYVATEVPVGRTLGSLLEGAPLQPDQVHAIIGSVAQTLGAARRRGLRHLHISPERLWITPSNEVYVDGVGIAAALSGVQSPDMTPAEADRLEVRRLLGFAASLLIGRPLSNPDDVDSAIAGALARPDLSPQLRRALSDEAEGLGAPLASTLAKELSPVPPLDVMNFSDPHAARFFPTEQLRPAGASQTDDAAAQPNDAPTESLDSRDSEAEILSAKDSGAEDAIVQSPDVNVTRESAALELGSHRSEQIDPNADPSKTARFPKITAPLGGGAVPVSAAANATEVLGVTSAADAPFSDPRTSDEQPETRSFDEVISPDSADGPTLAHNPAIKAGFAAGLAQATQIHTNADTAEDSLADVDDAPPNDIGEGTGTDAAAEETVEEVDVVATPPSTEASTDDGRFDEEPEMDPELGIVPPPPPGLAPQWIKPDEFARELSETEDSAVAPSPAPPVEDIPEAESSLSGGGRFA